MNADRNCCQHRQHRQRNRDPIFQHKNIHHKIKTKAIKKTMEKIMIMTVKMKNKEKKKKIMKITIKKIMKRKRKRKMRALENRSKREKIKGIQKRTIK